MALDPSALQTMEMASQVLVAQDTIRRQRRTIWALVAALRSSQRAQIELADLLDQVLAGDNA
jgi:hypothetical protein